MRELIVVGLSLLCLSCGENKAPEMEYRGLTCENGSNVDGLPCSVSIYSLVAFPRQYDEKTISVKGYISSGKYIVLFADQASAEYSILENGIELRVRPDQEKALTAASRRGDYVRVVGTFSSNVRDTNVLDGGDLRAPAGILDVMRISAVNENAWSCSFAGAPPDDLITRANPCPSEVLDEGRQE